MSKIDEKNIGLFDDQETQAEEKEEKKILYPDRPVMYEEDPEEGEEFEVDEKFRVTDLNSADWCLEKIAEKEALISEVRDLATAKKQLIDRWEQKETERHLRSIQFFQYLLGQYLAEQREKDPKFKISTPMGLVSTRAQQPEWNIEDEDRVIELLEISGQSAFIRVKKELKKGDIKKACTEIRNGVPILITGTDQVMLQGIKVEERLPKLTVKINEEALKLKKKEVK